MQHKKVKEHILIPALIAAAAAYFGFKKKSEKLASVAKDLVERAIDDQARTNQETLALPYKYKRRRARGKRNYRDRYYE